jgi:hypothetical protein
MLDDIFLLMITKNTYKEKKSPNSNLTIAFIKTVLMEGLPITSINDFCRNNEENKNIEKAYLNCSLR